MHSIIKKAAAIAASTVAISAVGMSVSAPDASAKAIKKHGTITTAEATKVYKGMLRQKCLTVKETRKIVGARGSLWTDPEETEYRYLDFNGAKKSRLDFAQVEFVNGCADHIWSWKK